MPFAKTNEAKGASAFIRFLRIIGQHEYHYDATKIEYGNLTFLTIDIAKPIE